jgi:hypothetical protein
VFRKPSKLCLVQFPFFGICAIPNLCSLIDCWQEQEHGRTIPLAEVGSAGDRENPQ